MKLVASKLFFPMNSWRLRSNCFWHCKIRAGCSHLRPAFSFPAEFLPRFSLGLCRDSSDDHRDRGGALAIHVRAMHALSIRGGDSALIVHTLHAVHAASR